MQIEHTLPDTFVPASPSECLGLGIILSPRNASTWCFHSCSYPVGIWCVYVLYMYTNVGTMCMFLFFFKFIKWFTLLFGSSLLSSVIWRELALKLYIITSINVSVLYVTNVPWDFPETDLVHEWKRSRQWWIKHHITSKTAALVWFSETGCPRCAAIAELTVQLYFLSVLLSPPCQTVVTSTASISVPVHFLTM